MEIDLGQVKPGEEELRELIDESFRENMGGAKIMQDAEGNWGLLTPGADAVVPFSKGGGGSGGKCKSVDSYAYVNYNYKSNFFGIDVTDCRKLKVTGTFRGRVTTSSYSRSHYIELRGSNKDGASVTHRLASNTSTNSTVGITTSIDMEIDCSNDTGYFYLYVYIGGNYSSANWDITFETS